MKPLLPFSAVLLVAVCFGQPQSAGIESPSKAGNALAESYTVMTDAPDAMLDEISSKYSGDNQHWRNKWKQDNSNAPLDGQRTIRLLEIACYADVMCHPVEYPLRVATHDYVREHLDIPEVRDALNWVRSSYNSGLPLDAPGDDAGDFKGLLVESMKSRITEYANTLLKSRETTTDRK